MRENEKLCLMNSTEVFKVFLSSLTTLFCSLSLAFSVHFGANGVMRK